MKAVLTLQNILEVGYSSIHMLSEEEMSAVLNKGRWSKKQILGHLIDSARYNLTRLTEAQFIQSPYSITQYNQEELVRVNNYQYGDITDLINLWVLLNKQIIHVLQTLFKNNSDFLVCLPNGSKHDLSFLVNDYISHLKHHLKQMQENDNSD